MQYSKIDLHCHSLESDGALTPSAVADRALANGVSLLALTDHDTIAGQQEAFARARGVGLKMVTGIELSCQWRGLGVHVLGLNFSLEDGVMQEAQLRQTVVRQERAKLIAAVLMKKGLVDFLAAAQALAKSGIPGRPHFAEAMVNVGAVKDHSEAFKKYLGSGKPGDIKTGWPELSEVVSWIRAAQGTAVLAHPRKYVMSLTKLRELIAEFKLLGGAGLEVIVAGQKQGEAGMIADLCRRFQLKGSVGSDFHTPSYPWADLGRIPVLPLSVTPIWEDWC